MISFQCFHCPLALKSKTNSNIKPSTGGRESNFPFRDLGRGNSAVLLPNIISLIPDNKQVIVWKQGNTTYLCQTMLCHLLWLNFLQEPRYNCKLQLPINENNFLKSNLYVCHTCIHPLRYFLSFRFGRASESRTSNSWRLQRTRFLFETLATMLHLVRVSRRGGRIHSNSCFRRTSWFSNQVSDLIRLNHALNTSLHVRQSSSI